MKWWRGLGVKLFGSHLLVALVAIGTAVVLGRWFTTGHVSSLVHTAGSSFTMEEHFLNILNQSLLWAMGGATLLAVGVSALFARYLSRPIDRMRRAAQAIAAGDYSRRVEAKAKDEVGELAKSFNEMASNLEAQERMRRELIANVAHELRTPLTSIQGYMEGLTDGVFTPEPSVFRRVHDEASRLKRMADDLGHLSSLESGLDVGERMPVDLISAIESAMARFQPLFLQKGVKLAAEHAASLPEPMGDRDQLEQMLNNLLANALQFTPSGGSVSLSAEEQKGGLLITVQDTGCGISKGDLPHIFERFYRVDRSRARTTGGAGIGLTIVKDIVERHGGEVAVASTQGEGSTFRVHLPYRRHE